MAVMDARAADRAAPIFADPEGREHAPPRARSCTGLHWPARPGNLRAMDAPKSQPPLFSGNQGERQAVARALGILSPPNVEPQQARLVVYLSRIDGEWRGTLATNNGELERFVGETIEHVQMALIGAAMILAAAVADDASWSTAQKENLIGGDE